MPSLITHYLGLTLHNPLIATATPLAPRGGGLGRLRHLEDTGAGAIAVSHSLPAPGFHSTANAWQAWNSYLDMLRKAGEAIGIPVIATVHGGWMPGWVALARMVMQAGVSAIELDMANLCTEAEPDRAHAHAHALGGAMGAIVGHVCDAVLVPVSVRLMPQRHSIGRLAGEILHNGAAGLVLAALPPATAHAPVAPARAHPLACTAVVASQAARASIATFGPRPEAADVVRSILAGAHAVITPPTEPHAATTAMLLDGLRTWMIGHGHPGLRDMRGDHRSARTHSGASVDAFGA